MVCSLFYVNFIKVLSQPSVNCKLFLNPLFPLLMFLFLFVIVFLIILSTLVAKMAFDKHFRKISRSNNLTWHLWNRVSFTHLRLFCLWEWQSWQLHIELFLNSDVDFDIIYVLKNEYKELLQCAKYRKTFNYNMYCLDIKAMLRFCEWNIDLKDEFLDGFCRRSLTAYVLAIPKFWRKSFKTARVMFSTHLLNLCFKSQSHQIIGQNLVRLTQPLSTWDPLVRSNQLKILIKLWNICYDTNQYRHEKFKQDIPDRDIAFC